VKLDVPADQLVVCKATINEKIIAAGHVNIEL